MFLGNVHESCEITDISDHIENITQCKTFKCAKLATRTGNCYKIEINEESYEKIMDTNNWPVGVKIDKFYNRTTPREATTIFRRSGKTKYKE